MNERRILCDVDGVWADFHSTAFDILYPITGRKYALEEFHDWDIFETVPRIYEDSFYEVWKRPGTCLSIPVIPGSAEGVKGLLVRGDLHVVTSPMRKVPTWTHERDLWLEKHFGIRSKVHHTSDKYAVSGDVLIEDKPSNLYKWLEHHPEGIGILWSQPYNEKIKPDQRIHRARTWADVFAILDAAPKKDPFADFFARGEDDGKLSIDDLREEARRQGIPGPDTKKHPEKYDGPCLCAECMSYGEG